MSEQAEVIEVIAGTYEEYLLGYIFSRKEKSLIQSFASHNHSGSIRCLATSENYLASGGTDDRIVIYDLKSRKEHCMLTHHESTITSLAFTTNHSHIISASQDGSLAIVRVGNWQLEKQWKKAHKEGAITDIALHSSGKLALTLGNDATVHTWNLVKGREAYIINLKTKCAEPKSLERLRFAPDDSRFVMFGGKYSEIWSIKVGGALKVIEHEQKVTCCIWLSNEQLFVGYEDGNIAVVDVESGEKHLKIGHEGRVKVAECSGNYIVTASSSGEIKVWNRKLKELSRVNTGCRITCLTIAKWMANVKKEKVDECLPVRETVKHKSFKSTVIVEVDESSDEGMSEVRMVTKKRKKGKTGTEINDMPVKVKNDKKQKVDEVAGVNKSKRQITNKKNKVSTSCK